MSDTVPAPTASIVVTPQGVPRPVVSPTTRLDRRLADAIRAGGGIATRAELRRAGLDGHAVRRRLDSTTLVEVFPGVLAYPQGALPPATRRRAALLSCGPEAALDLWTCAEHLGLVTFQARPGDRLHVLLPRSRRPRRAGTDIAVARTEVLLPQDVAEHDGLRCLSVGYLLLRLSADHPRRLIERFSDEAAYLGLWRPWDVEELLGRSAGHPGVATLRDVLRLHRPGTTRTENELEEAFMAICDGAGWPRPICQQPDRLPDGRRIRHDFLWPDLRFSVETDGGRGHAGPRRSARDRARDAALRARGHETARVWWNEVFDRPRVVRDRVGPRLRDAQRRAAARRG